MHPYLPHLLADIAKAHRKDTPSAEMIENMDENEAFQQEFEELERFVKQKGLDHDLGYYSGLKASDFPPEDQFTDNEKQQVFDAFQTMLLTWNAALEFPKNLPISLQYRCMIKALDKKFMLLNHSFIGIDFCTGRAPGCIYEEFCPCWGNWN